ncbi:MAG: glutamate--tRNA ligase family protein [Vicinamibacterales bacterium]
MRDRRSAAPYAPYLQSERLDTYRAMAEGLVASGKAYCCYCSPEELQARRAEARRPRAARGATTARVTRSDAEDARCLEAEQRPSAIRFFVPPGTAEFDDLVRGHIVFENANIEDFVILRSDGYPTYHLSVVADDVEMKMTHVVRGDDHISNTPKHVLLYEAVGAPVPQFAHVPLILGPDKKRLSKRHGATSVMEYARQGYLPEAMLNFLALLGWSPGAGDRELFTADELKEMLRSARHQRRERGLQPGETGLVQPAAHAAARAVRARAARAPLLRSGGTLERRLPTAIAMRGSSRCSSC